MLKFAVMQLRWEFRKDESMGVQRYRYQYAGLRHDAAFTAEGEPVLHLISETQATDDSHFLGYELSTEIDYAILPEAFQQAEHPTLKEPLSRLSLEGGYLIAFPEGHILPAALPLYIIAFEHAKTKNHFVLIHVMGKKVTVAAFSEQKPLLINTFPAGNEAEALYFALGPFKRAGIAVNEVEVEVLSDSAIQAPLLDLFGRFLANVKPCPFSLPYEVGQYPPHADISLLLFTLPQCGLQAVI